MSETKKPTLFERVRNAFRLSDGPGANSFSVNNSFEAQTAAGNTPTSNASSGSIPNQDLSYLGAQVSNPFVPYADPNKADSIYDEAVETEPEKATIVHFKPIGSYGSFNYAGYPREEYLSTLQGRARANIFDQMRRSDPQIKMCLSAIKNPIKGGTWEIEPGDESDDAKADAELIEHILFNDLDKTWKKFIDEVLSMIDFGHSVFEVTHKVVLDHPKYGNYAGIRDFGFRSQRTIERWHLDPYTGHLDRIAQYAFGDLYRLIDIPAQFLILFSVDREGANYEGISMLRPCYGNWFRKQQYLKANAIGIEKFAIPTPLIEVPRGLENSEQFDRMIQVIQAYQTHENNFLTYPEGFKVDLKTNTYDPQKVEVAIENEDKRMVNSFLCNFLNLSGGTGGSYALSSELKTFFLSSLDYIIEEIKSPLNSTIIPGLIQLNRGNKSVYPKIKCTGVSDKGGKELAEVLRLLAETQYITPDDKLEVHLRNRYDLPERGTEGIRKPKENKEEAAGSNPDDEGSRKQTPTKGIQNFSELPLIDKIRLSEYKRRGII